MTIQAGFMFNLKNIKSCTQAFDVIYKNRKNKNRQNTTVSKKKLCASSWFMGQSQQSIRRKGSRGLVDRLVQILVVCKGQPRRDKKLQKKKYYCQLKTFTNICLIYFDFLFCHISIFAYLCLVIPTIILDFFYTSWIQFDMMPPNSVWRMGLNKTGYDSKPYLYWCLKHIKKKNCSIPYPNFYPTSP